MHVWTHELLTDANNVLHSVYEKQLDVSNGGRPV